jgi:hypothetical protein
VHEGLVPNRASRGVPRVGGGMATPEEIALHQLAMVRELLIELRAVRRELPQ